MSDSKSSARMEQQLATEVAALRELAVKSSDPMVVSKAIAVSDKGIQQMILDRLEKGEKLIEVFVPQGPSLTELQVFFRFTQPDQITPLTESGVLVFVDIAKGEVMGAVDPYVLPPERRVGRPFVAATAQRTIQSPSDTQALAQAAEGERAFFANLGLSFMVRNGLGICTDTVCNTDTTSVTYQPTGPGGRYAGEDTGKETTGDYCDSQGPILA